MAFEPGSGGRILTAGRRGSVACRACTSTSGCLCTKTPLPCARQRFRLSLAALRLHHGRRTGDAVPEVLFAKDAISTGWDCPRAEVLVSFRPARDETHITQLLGRMVRTPLARRVPGDDMLNSVACLLPRFDRRTATRVAQTMMGEREADADGTGGGTGRRVLLAPVDMVANTARFLSRFGRLLLKFPHRRCRGG